jgi:thioredoxin 1
MIAYITELNSDNFNDFKSNELVLVDIFATWCGPCRMISPIIDQISNEYQGRLVVGKMDADQNRDLVMELGIRSIPTLLLFKSGEEVGRLVGSVTKEKIVELIEENIN